MEIEKDEVVEEHTEEEAPKDEVEVEEPTEEPADDIDWKERALKAEKLIEKNKKKAKEDKPTNPGNLNQTDILYLAKADIHEEDLSELTTYAEKMGVSVKEAHEYLKPRFEIKNEERRTAMATEVKSPRGKKESGGDDLLKKALETGEVPTDDKAMQEMILAKQRAGRGKS